MLRFTGRGFYERYERAARRRRGRALRGTAVAVALLCAYGLGVLTGPAERRPAPGERSLVDEAADRIAQDAAQPIDRPRLQRAAVDGMLRSLGDRWARYYTAREYDDMKGRLNGRYSGVGIWLGVVDGAESSRGAVVEAADAGSIQVASVQPGSAAAQAGVRAGDVVADVDGKQVSGWSVSKVAAALRGGPGTAVTLGVRRGGADRRFRLVRTAVQTSDVTVEQPTSGTRLIRIAAFTKGVGREVRDAIAYDPARHRGGILLDLRGNPGGLLDEAVDTASAFLSGGLVVTYERRGAAPERFEVTEPGDAKTPLVVLVDAGTASAAEVVAGSLRDRDRAVIVGSRTYGKGSVQAPIRLKDGSAIELTVGRYRTPSGRSLDGVGIDPDVAVSSDRPPQEAEQRAQAVLRGLLATSTVP